MMMRAILGAAACAAIMAAGPAWTADRSGPGLYASPAGGVADALFQGGVSAPRGSGFVMGASPDAVPRYYFNNGGEVAGPISYAELTSRIAAGSIRLDTVIWKDGMAAWMQARYLPEIAVLYDRRTDRPAVNPLEPPVEVLPAEPERPANPPNDVTATTDVAPAPVTPAADPNAPPAVADRPATTNVAPVANVAPAPAVAPAGPATPVTGPAAPVVADAPTGPVQPPQAVNAPVGPATPTGPATTPQGPAVAPVAVTPAADTPAPGPAPEAAAQADPAFTDYMVGTWTFPDNGNPPSILTAKLLPTGEISGIFDTAPPNQKERVKIDVGGKWLATRIDATHLSLTLDMVFRLGERTNPIRTVTALEVVDHDTVRDSGGGINKRSPG